MKSPASLARPTFRDPAGSLRIVGGRVFRTVRPEFADDCLSFLSSETAREWVASGRLIETQILHHSAGKQLELEHPRVSFPSYPWEWTPGQWVSAAELTLELAEHQIDAGRILKDATPLNVLFEGNKAIFVDVLSTESRDLNDPLWLAYGQFVRTFLLRLGGVQIPWMVAGIEFPTTRRLHTRRSLSTSLGSAAISVAIILTDHYSSFAGAEGELSAGH